MIGQRDRTGNVGSWSATMFVVRLLLAAVYVYAGGVKLWQNPGSFADSIASFRMLPPWLVTPLALALPPFEILTGLTLLIDWPKRLGAFGALVLGTLFLMALATAMARGIPVDCGCFGAGPGWLPLAPNQRVWFDLGRDTVLALAGLFLYRHEAAVNLNTSRA